MPADLKDEGLRKGGKDWNKDNIYYVLKHEVCITLRAEV